MIPPLDELSRQLKKRLGDDAGGRPLPGTAAHNRMAPRPRRSSTPSRPLVDAAVLVLLYPLDGRPHFVLTERTATVTHHRSQVSLPGGRREGTETLSDAALREAREELAVDPGSLGVLGFLSPIAVSVSGFLIHPVVAWTTSRPDFKADPGEVAHIIEVSLETLADPRASKRETRSIEGIEREIPFFELHGHKVWGATAMALSELLAILEDF
jgi:8-oxo-dGTP pyrophosphatase MutT (NUDIX family)